jgi:uncharacterized protein YbaP (TraB family)
LIHNTRGIYYYSVMRALRILFYGWLALLVLPVSRLAAQETHPAASGLHCLWKAQGKSNVVYMLGTVHLLRDTDYPLPQVMESAFTNSRIAVFEVDLDKADDPVYSMGLVQKAILPHGQTLSQLLPAKVYGSLSNHVQELGMPMMMFDSMKPGMAIVMLEAMELTKLGADPQYGEDEHFFKLAKESGRQIVPLETIEFQLDLMMSFDGPDLELLIEKSLEDIDNEKKEYADLVAAWKQGDSAGLETMLNEMRTNAPPIFKKLVSDRTASWVPKVNDLLNGSQNAIIIVGAGHLVGPDGLVELLKKQGVKVTQL